MSNAIRHLLTTIDGVVRIAGVATNAALLGGFGWATSCLATRAKEEYLSVSTLPSPSTLLGMLSNPETMWAAVSLITNAQTHHKLQSGALFWVYLVLAAGCGWMTLLGLRWAYHTILAAIQLGKNAANKA